MKMIQILNWKKVDIWMKLYGWITYICPHFLYGAYIFNKSGNEVSNSGSLPLKSLVTNHKIRSRDSINYNEEKK